VDDSSLPFHPPKSPLKAATLREAPGFPDNLDYSMAQSAESQSTISVETVQPTENLSRDVLVPQIPDPTNSENQPNPTQRRRANIQFVTLCWTLFLAGWNDGTTGPLLPRIQKVYEVCVVSTYSCLCQDHYRLISLSYLYSLCLRASFVTALFSHPAFLTVLGLSDRSTL